MTFRPLFFLPRRALRWAHDQAYSEHLMDTPFLALFISIDNLGIWFPYKGDEVVWTWPWRRKDRGDDNRGMAPFISLGFSGNGDWGDARYWTLAELDADWAGYENSLFYGSPAHHRHMDDLCEQIADEVIAKQMTNATEALMEEIERQDIAARLAEAFPDPVRLTVPDFMEELGKAFDDIDKRT